MDRCPLHKVEGETVMMNTEVVLLLSLLQMVSTLLVHAQRLYRTDPDSDIRSW
jgi:hypothetical protein